MACGNVIARPSTHAAANVVARARGCGKPPAEFALE
jgi:hypothetical protein